MCKLYVFQTRIGPFFIAYSRGRYTALFENEPLGSFATEQEAARHLAMRDGFLVAGGVSTATLGIPPSLQFWERCLQAAAGA